ncbi:dolichol kinase [Extremus antarcticus]|uniref:dolichol kinase n=1 Tax=Extremus antarcticus TaxID=702011 RepID=A0AAJ0DG26_9PEZI|nr:dolichol kinase [Extremus antarcticus]
MVADAQPPDVEISATSSQGDDDGLHAGTRTPRPYHHEADAIWQGANSGSRALSGARGTGKGSKTPDNYDQAGQLNDGSGRASPTWSESGTEADDERPSFVKALPAPHLRPRKGLKTGEQNEDALLTPSQLDDEGRRLSQDYFGDKIQGKRLFEKEDKDEQEKLFRRRLAEFARRTSEVGLMLVIVLCVLCGGGVLDKVYQWRWELVSQLAIIISLILAYPVKLSIVDTQSQARKLWERFRVPASFDPATVLYPPLLPVLVALLVSPANPAVIIPNIVLGLASLPQRLFPRSSRLGGFNTLHWLICIIPVVVSENTLWPTKDCHREPYLLRCPPAAGLTPETLVSLYPLHHALLIPLHYLTTTSLLISELHLLSVVLINLLLLAQSPQTIMLKACLWIGGITLFVSCAPVLQWNVTLIRVPRWKLRRPGHTAEERKSLVDSVSELINLQRATAVFTSSAVEDSDADEDEPATSIKQQQAFSKPKLTMSNLKRIATLDDTVPRSAIDPAPAMNGALPEFLSPINRLRRNTLPPREAPALSERQQSNSRQQRSTYLPWYLHLTSAQVQRRKWLYMAYIYVVMAVIILFLVRNYVQEKALDGQEPISWAITYIIGQLQPFRNLLSSLGMSKWISLPPVPANWRGIHITFPLDIPAMRSTLGAANVRILLIGYWGVVLLAGLLAVFSLTSLVEVDTRRKVFHGVMVAMMLPATFVDPCACALALTLILAVFLLLEIIRAGQVQPLGNAISRFVAPYVDGRDLRGPVVVSHFFLLIGCAVPMWFSLASIERAGYPPWSGWELDEDRREVAMIAGVVCVGMGDAAASLIGRRYGRRKWVWVGGKSLEGSAAFAVAVTIGLLAAKAWLVFGGWSDNNGSVAGHSGRLGGIQCGIAWTVTLAKAVFCACGASFMEAVLTGANDNVVVPVALWLLVKGARV